ncbi:MAG: PEP-utilizing enzyme, partial [Planctomycetes bacterium]|nr:PEP-utilizing enzyme [Planctomycetota bacterium]
SPEDVHGMHAAQAILTAKGGMTSHAALVARGWGKCCIVGCSAVDIDAARKVMTVAGQEIREGDWITLNGTLGALYAGQLPLVFPDLEHNEEVKLLLTWVDKMRRLGVRTNADTPKDAARGRAFGAAGIGLFRTEHMFYGEGSDQPLFLLRKMIASSTVEERRRALDELYPFMKKDIKDTLEVMHGLPVTIRLLDPPLHEFVPHDAQRLADLAASLGITLADLEKRADGLRESNPMMGHRGVRLGITYPEVSECQVRAILEATAELLEAGVKVLPEIMIPVTSVDTELEDQARLVRRVHDEVAKKFGMKKVPHLYGTMIEIPRAALTADRIAEHTEFFSFGTNDLTQMTFGFSRDDIGGFLPYYLRDTDDTGAKKRPLLPADPFGTIDRDGVGELVRVGIERGRKTRPDLKVGICGEHGGDPASVWFCHEVGMNYVSCSPFRVPIARLAAAHAALADADAAAAAPKKAPAKKPAGKAPAAKPAPKKGAAKKPAGRKR